MRVWGLLQNSSSAWPGQHIWGRLWAQCPDVVAPLADPGFLQHALCLTFNLNSIHIRLYVAYSLIDLVST